MPATERKLWVLLRDRRLEGLKFRRQVRIGRYVADFACFRYRLVVEADGPFHDVAADAARDAWLAGQGFRVLRFSNQQIEAGDDVIHAIWSATRPRDPSSDLLRRPPSPARGEGHSTG
jgi:very-short-patch-repair endonuclease